MTSLVDTNVLVYCFDPRSPEKRRIATELIRRGLGLGELTLPHQVIVEFVAAVKRPRRDLGGSSLLSAEQAYWVAEDLVSQFPILYPDEEVLVTALRGVQSYNLSWFDAHLWAYAEVNGLAEILTEDFEHGRYYGSVRAVDPFLSAADSVYELPAMYEIETEGASSGRKS